MARRRSVAARSPSRARQLRCSRPKTRTTWFWASAPNADGAIPIEVDIVEELGSDAFVYGSVPNEFGESKEIHFAAGESQLVVRIDPRDVPKKGDTVWVTIRAGEQHTFSAATGKRLTKGPVVTAASTHV